MKTRISIEDTHLWLEEKCKFWLIVPINQEERKGFTASHAELHWLLRYVEIPTSSFIMFLFIECFGL